jgi:hypothetical protein
MLKRRGIGQKHPCAYYLDGSEFVKFLMISIYLDSVERMLAF